MSRFVLLAALTLAAFAPASYRALERVGVVELPEVDGRIDHMAIDSGRQRLFVSCVANHTVEVVDLASERSFRSLREWSQPQGACYVASGDRVFVADGNGDCVVLDGGVLERLVTVKLGDDADNVREDPANHRVYVAFGSGGITALDAHSGQRQGTATFGGHPEAFVIEPGGSRMFVDVPEAREVVVIDRERQAVVAHWPIPLAGNYPMALDTTAHRLYVGCRQPTRLLVMDSRTGKALQAVPLGGDVDDLWVDAERHRLYASCGTGTVQVFATPGRPRLIASVNTAPGARTSLFVPETGRLYVAVPRGATQKSAEIRIYQAH